MATRALVFPADHDRPEPLGEASLQRLRARLGWLAQACAAPTLAAQATATALAAAVETLPVLRDCDYGRWAGRGMAVIEAEEPAAFAAWLSDPEAAPHGGESLAAVVARLRGWLADVAAHGGRIVAVASPLVVRAVVVAALDLPLPLFWRLDAAPLGMSRLSATNGRWRLAGFNALPSP